jgi:predicted dehydrogenase
LISGSMQKMRTVASQYGIPEAACYSYADIGRIKNNPAIEVVYVVLPNSLHRDAVVSAAQAGKHVLCEKPMATTPDDARQMVAGCKKANRRLMIAYRCQFEVYNRELARRVRAGELGAPQFIDAVNVQNQGDPGQWRQKRELAGGGSLPDVGLYCLNTIRALLGEEPIEVSASIHSPPDDPRFAQVESTASFTMRFPSGVIANCASSYSAHKHQNLRVLGPLGAAEIENAFAYEGQRLRISRRGGKAETNTEFVLAHANQFSLEIDHMAHCVRDNLQPRTPGEEGLQDHILMDAIYRAAQTGQRVQLEPVAGLDSFRGPEPVSD